MSSHTIDAEAQEFPVKSLPIIRIRTDGGTQIRSSLRQDIVETYSSLMVSGVCFPPVTVWFDGESYWLSDGFHRLAAARQIGRHHLEARVKPGTAADARWDSFAANSGHGLRRGNTDLATAIKRALEHPYSADLSDIQIAKHLGVPETTFRRWRNRLSPPRGGDSPFLTRVACRNGKSYSIRVDAIGRGRLGIAQSRSKLDLKEALCRMKTKASPDARSLLNVVGNWMFSATTDDDCLSAIESICRRLTRH